jgi:hypothetical protein
LWRVSAGLDWPEIAELSKAWANPQELALARQFVERLEGDETALTEDSGVLYYELSARDARRLPLVSAIQKLLEKHVVLGLKARPTVPSQPHGAALACRVQIDEAKVEVNPMISNNEATAWIKGTSFTFKLGEATGDSAAIERKAAEVVDSLAAGLLGRLVRVQVAKGQRVKGKDIYKIRIETSSPLILNGLALAGPDDLKTNPPTMLNGFCLPPGKSWTAPASADLVERLKLKDGARAVAADLSGL